MKNIFKPKINEIWRAIKPYAEGKRVKIKIAKILVRIRYLKKNESLKVKVKLMREYNMIKRGLVDWRTLRLKRDKT